MLTPRILVRFFTLCVLTVVGGAVASAQDSASSTEATPTAEIAAPRIGPAQVVVIPVRAEIAQPILYVIRRGLKTAIEMEADLVVLDMETPGGSLGTTFEILEALSKFKGETVTYVNSEAISAGSFISAMTDDIYFAPDGVIGAAAPVMSSGGEMDDTMKLKIVSYLKARIRSISEGHPYRGQVISAMIDADYELKIGDEILKPKGELLSLTATEAAATYGDPAQSLLAAGITDSIDALLVDRFGEDGYETLTLETTWSEDFAAVLNGFAPILMGLGLLGLFIEFKTPGFGIFGIGGGLLLVIVFFGHNVAGLSGHEPMLFFAIGVLLLFAEILFFPGTVVFALSGVILMMGSLVWSMADLWPNEPLSVPLSGDVFVQPLISLVLGIGVAIVGAVIVLRFLPRGWFWDRMVLATAAGGDRSSFTTISPPATEAEVGSLVGKTGVAATDMYPSGQVKLNGRWYEARVDVGAVDAGAPVVVREQQSFGLIVEPVVEEDDV